jgi:hypothetical protein
MGDTRLRPLQLVDSDEAARRFDAMVETMAGAPTPKSAPQLLSVIAAEVGRLVILMERLKERVDALEAELVPPYRSRKCPCCHRIALTVVATRLHPVFGTEGIEQHDVRCDCGYHTSRVYDPRDFLR